MTIVISAGFLVTAGGGAMVQTASLISPEREMVIFVGAAAVVLLGLGMIILALWSAAKEGKSAGSTSVR